ncbi:MAG TPA: hypothetical protein VLV87_12395 [Gammaproteobacteria bacterium]|nr:hypothetical protein [Gammaproteobacteria bacterium]
MSSPSFSSRLFLGIALALALALAGCGGGSNSSLSGSGGGGGAGGGGSGGSTGSGTDCTQPTSSDLDGCTYVSLSDDTGDFLAYRVKVAKIVLTRRDGTAVSLIPSSTTVDFAQYTSLSEFLSLNAVPAGDYVSGVITLDFTGADIEAQDASGNAVRLSPVDSSGHALAAKDVTIAFDGDHPLSLFPGQAHLLGINFDLNASNVIHTGNDTVTVEPFLVASIDAATGTQQVRGPLSAVGSSTVTLALRPFQADSQTFGKFVVYTTASTSYIVNQKIYSGSAGLTALHSANAGIGVIALGNFDFTNRRFVATQILAGTSAPGGSSDAVEGVVTARNLDTLTVRGADLYRSTGTVSFDDTITVTVGSGTVVREVDQIGLSRNSADISVGQHVLVFGSLSGSTLDATHGFALLRFTAVDGQVLSLVNAAANSSVNLNVDQIQDRPISLFDFSGTNSDPTNYLVSLPCSCLNTGVTVGDPVTVAGFPSAFGTAPPDFNAQALTDFGLSGTVLSVVWSNAAANAFSSINANSGVVPNLSSSPATATLREGGQVTDLTSSGTPPAVFSKSLGIYAISKGGTVQLYLSFTNFVNALHADLSAGSKVRGFYAVGGYDVPDDLLNATTIAVVLD